MTLKHKTIVYEYFLFALLVCLGVALVVGGGFKDAVTEGLSIWAFSVLPSLFPYTVISISLSKLGVTTLICNKFTPITKRIFNTSGVTAYAYFISLLAGYPMGAKTVADLKENGYLTDAEAQRAVAFCSTSSPMFLISTVGGICFGSIKFGFLLFLTQVISSLVLGVVFSFYKRKDKPRTRSVPYKSCDNLFYESVFSAITSMLTVGGTITFFSVVSKVLTHFNVLAPAVYPLGKLLGSYTLANGFVVGLLECSNGLTVLGSCGIGFLSLPIACFICGFGGISIIMQSLTYIKSAKIKTAPFLLAKVGQAVLSFLLGLIFNLFL